MPFYCTEEPRAFRTMSVLVDMSELRVNCAYPYLHPEDRLLIERIFGRVNKCDVHMLLTLAQQRALCRLQYHLRRRRVCSTLALHGPAK